METDSDDVRWREGAFRRAWQDHRVWVRRTIVVALLGALFALLGFVVTSESLLEALRKIGYGLLLATFYFATELGFSLRKQRNEARKWIFDRLACERAVDVQARQREAEEHEIEALVQRLKSATKITPYGRVRSISGLTPLIGRIFNDGAFEKDVEEALKLAGVSDIGLSGRGTKDNTVGWYVDALKDEGLLEEDVDKLVWTDRSRRFHQKACELCS